MSETYYIRIRGRVHGPFGIAKLEQLIQKGQVSKIHEISTDNRSWQSAASMPELFEKKRADRKPMARRSIEEAEPENAQASHQATSNVTNLGMIQGANITSGNPGGPPGMASLRDWHYMLDGAQLGPATTAEIFALAKHGSLNRDDMVWKASMSQWAPAGYCPELVSAFRRRGSVSDGDKPIKSKGTAIVLALFLGGLGIHHFYLGNSLRGLLFVILFIFAIGWIINPIVALIEAIVLACTSEENFQEKWCHKGWNF